MNSISVHLQLHATFDSIDFDVVELETFTKSYAEPTRTHTHTHTSTLDSIKLTIHHCCCAMNTRSPFGYGCYGDSDGGSSYFSRAHKFPLIMHALGLEISGLVARSTVHVYVQCICIHLNGERRTTSRGRSLRQRD